MRACVPASLLLALCFKIASAQSPADGVRFAVIGDYGDGGDRERAVAAMVDGWTPEFIVTTGDNNYPRGEASTIDKHIGQFYHRYIFPYTGAYGPGASENRFFPSLGNHDWMSDSAAPYLAYFTLPGNERYYEFARGPVRFFIIDSDKREPDGVTADSRQAGWLRDALGRAVEPWKIVVMHHPPYSSSTAHGSTSYMQWPYREWGANVVLAGHDHTYERIMRDSLLYIVNGLGGAKRYEMGAPIEGSLFRYAEDYGAMLVTAEADRIVFRFIDQNGEEIDVYTLQAVSGAVSGK